MLTPLRNMLRSPWAGGIFVIVIISMAAWGVTDIFTGGSGRSLVSAGDRAVSDRILIRPWNGSCALKPMNAVAP